MNGNGVLKMEEAFVFLKKFNWRNDRITAASHNYRDSVYQNIC